eukprot:UN20949
MGELARVDKDEETAKELFLVGNILDKANPHTAYSLGIWHLFGAKERDFEKAKDLMIATINRDKGWWKGYHGLGVTYRLWRKNGDALRILNKAFERHPLSTKVLDDLGHVNFELENRFQFSICEKSIFPPKIIFFKNTENSTCYITSSGSSN